MKTQKIRKLTLVFLTLVLTGSAVFAQGWRGGNRQGFGRNMNWTADSIQPACVNLIQGLTDAQKEEITSLEAEHQKTMAELRTQRRSVTDAIEKNEIRGEMLKQVKAHREEVRNLLNEEQKDEYDLLQAGNQGRMQGFAQGRRNAPRGAAFANGNRGGRGRAAGCVRGRMGNGRGFNSGGACFYNN
jgi:hypothetical protein